MTTGARSVPRPSARLGAQGLAAAAGLIALVTLASRAVGVARWAAFSHAVGATEIGGVYATVNTVPNVMFEIAAGGALAAVVVPLVARHLNAGLEELADRTASALLGWTLLILLPLSLLLAAAAGPVAAVLLGAGHDEDAVAAGRFMLLLFAPQVLLYGVGIVLTGVLQAHRRFLAAALAPLLSSLVVIGVYLLFGALYDPTGPLAGLPRASLVLLAGGTTAGVVALSLPLILPIVRLGVRWRPTLRFPGGRDAARTAGALAVAGLLGVGAQQLFTVVVLLLANTTGVGGVPVWNYAQTVYLLPYAVLVVPLATVAFPRLADEPGAARRTLRRAMTGALAGAVAGAALLIATRHDVGTLIVALDSGSGGAGRETLDALPVTLALLAPGLIGFSLIAVLTRALYAAGHPWDAAAGTMLGWSVGGAVALLAVPLLPGTGIGGVLAVLAGASSLGMLLAALVLLARTRTVWGPGALRGPARVVPAVLLAGGATVLLREVLPWRADGAVDALILGAATTLVGVALAGLALRLLAPAALAPLTDRLRRGRTGAVEEES